MMPDREMIALKIDLQMKAADKTVEIMVYGVIVRDATYYTDATGAKDLDKALKEAKKNGATKLYLRVNSPGGLCAQAIAMRTMIINYGFESIVESIEGISASAATLLMCIPGAHVVIAEGSELMIHRPIDCGCGTAEDFEREAKRMYKMEDAYIEIYAKHTGQTPDQIKAWMYEEKWLDAQEAVETGFAHEVQGAVKAVACVTDQQMAVMRGIYKNIPEAKLQMGTQQRMQAEPGNAPQENVSNDNPTKAAGGSPENTENSEEETAPMANANTPDVKDVKTMTLEELRAENPALFDSVMKSGGEDERKRMEEIDALTPIGYEEMAVKAKKDGTSAMDYNKMVIKAQRDKAAAFVAQRKTETAPGAAIPGAASEGTDPKDAAAMSDKNAQDIAAHAKQLGGKTDGNMF